MSSSADPGRPRVYFCHECNRRTSAVSEAFTCGLCDSGFIEEVSEATAAAAADPSAAEPSARHQHENFHYGNPLYGGQMDVMSHILGSLFATGAGEGAAARGGGFRIRQMPMDRQQPNFAAAGNPFLQDLLSNLAGIQPHEGGGAQHIQFIPGGVTMYGNPGDYAWGRGGLDAIVTQLLNQMDGTGPPPLRVDAIKSIPIVKVNQENVDSNAQCSVCWDDFKLDEEVRQLNCEHIYHEPCIVPWLELHGTCPVCRRSQEKEGAASAAASAAAAQSPSGEVPGGQPSSTLGNTISSVFNLFGFSPSAAAAGSSQTPSHTSTSTSTSSSGGGQGNNPDGGRRQSNNEDGPSRSGYEDFDLE